MHNLIKYIANFFQILLPIVGKAVVQTAVDELIDYSERQPRRKPASYTRYTRQERMAEINRRRTERLNQMRQERDFKPEPGFHDVLMVAFDITAPDAESAHKWLHSQMPPAQDYADSISVDSWWVANDERYDGSDTDSAVFVHKGHQEVARRIIRSHSLGN